ncbi:YoaK family protein [Kushneria aurantia]|uniref:YoaK family protein n=1 Tax=Kushneria aurantia TaxID=504092 RepID=A0ABV6G2G2_9GAMM|nr:YoaK family protein [Kushneria aurantia]
MINERPIPFHAFALLFVIAGATDALIYLHSRELLAVYMTGNSSHIGRAIGQGHWATIAPLAAVIGTFFVATTLAAWLGQRAGRWRATLILLLSGTLMALAVPFTTAGSYSLMTVAMIAAAMGSLNQVSSRVIGVTFLTGMIVQTGRSLAQGEWLAGLDGLARWAALIGGAVLATLLDSRYGELALLFVAGALAAGAPFTAWNAHLAGAGDPQREQADRRESRSGSGY